MVTAAAFMAVVMMTAAATFMAVVMMTAAVARMVVAVPVTAAARMLALCRMGIPGHNNHLMLYALGNLSQLFNQTVRILRHQPKLFGGKGDDSLLHFRKRIEFCFHFGRAVGTAQILHNIYFLFHMYPPFRINI